MRDGNRVPAFSGGEYEERARRVRDELHLRELDALLIVEPANMNWLTGYDARSYYTPQAVLITSDGDSPIWIGREIDVPCARWTTHLARESILGYPDQFVTDPAINAFQFIGGTVKRRVSTDATVGYEADAGTFTPRGFQALSGELELSGIKLVDADGLVNRIRAVKSDAEIDYMRQAAQIAMQAMDTAAGLIRPGVRECDVIAEVYKAALRGTDEFGGDYPITPNIATGRQTDSPHLTWSDKPFQEESPVTLELAGCRYRYHSGLSRSFYLGRPPQELTAIAAAVTDGYLAALEQLRPGRLCGEVASAFAKTAARGGVTKASRIGYSIGIGYPSASWSERAISLFAGDETVIEPNMTFHVMLGIWTESSGGYIFSETAAVTEDAPEVLTTARRDLMQLS